MTRLTNWKIIPFLLSIICILGFSKAKNENTESNVKDFIKSSPGLLFAEIEQLSPDNIDGYRNLIALSIDDLIKRADSLNRSGDWENALIYYSVIINNYELNRPNKGSEGEKKMVECLCRSGNIYYKRGLYTNAIKQYTKGLGICESSHVPEMQAELYKNIGNIYCSHNDFSMGETFYNKALNIALELKDTILQNTIYYNLAGAYCFNREIDKAKNTYHLLVSNPRLRPMDQYSAMMIEGLLLENDLNSTKAIEVYQKTAKFSIQNDLEYIYTASAYSGIARVYERIGILDSALCYLKKNEVMGLKAMKMDLLISTYQHLSEIFRKKNETEKSLSYKFKYLNLSDSVMNQKNFNELKNAQFLAEMDKHEAIITQLTTDKKNNEIQIQHQRRWLLTVSIFSFFILILLFIAYKQKHSLSIAYSDLFDRNQEQLEMDSFYKKRLSILENELQKVRAEQEESKNNKIENPKLALQKEEVNTPQKEKLLADILFIMDNTLEFCNSDFTVERLAMMVNSNSRLVSQTINEIYNKNFRSFLNDYRIKEAMRRLSDMDNYGHYTIQAIAESVGYKSQANFISVFTKQTGIKPSMYQRISQQKK